MVIICSMSRTSLADRRRATAEFEEGGFVGRGNALARSTNLVFHQQAHEAGDVLEVDFAVQVDIQFGFVLPG